MKYSSSQLYDWLEEKSSFYNTPLFIENDPISIPHRFNKKEDIEISGFLAATLAWGQRVTIIKKSNELLNLMENVPHDFVMNASENELNRLKSFVHRTFQPDDCMYFIYALHEIYCQNSSLEKLFTEGYNKNHSIREAIFHFRERFFSCGHLSRTRKHVPNPMKGAAAKRINMFLRWMVRNDHKGVDFGIWKNISTADLMCPLDVHAGNIARSLGLLQRKQDDWLAVEELTANLSTFDPHDPVKYDFALFGTGVNEK